MSIKKQLEKIIPKSVINFYHNIKFKGDAVHCPICDSHYREFVTFGLVRRHNARCLKCNSLERHRLLWLFFQRETDFFTSPQFDFLHCAPERTFYQHFASQKNMNYHSCDLFPEFYPHVKGIEKQDITQLSYADERFDVVLCSHVMEHIPEDSKAFSELFRVLKKGAYVIFQIPQDTTLATTYEDFSITDPKEREKHFGQNDHVRVYGMDFKNRAEKAGFDVLESDYRLAFSENDRFKYGLGRDEYIYLCKKAL